MPKLTRSEAKARMRARLAKFKKNTPYRRCVGMKLRRSLMNIHTKADVKKAFKNAAKDCEHLKKSK